MSEQNRINKQNLKQKINQFKQNTNNSDNNELIQNNNEDTNKFNKTYTNKSVPSITYTQNNSKLNESQLNKAISNTSQNNHFSSEKLSNNTNWGNQNLSNTRQEKTENAQLKASKIAKPKNNSFYKKDTYTYKSTNKANINDLTHANNKIYASDKGKSVHSNDIGDQAVQEYQKEVRKYQVDAEGNKMTDEQVDAYRFLKSEKEPYKHEHTLDASQDDPAKRRYINFKQDYVVLIRKKPFYAATAQQRTKTMKTETVYKDNAGNVVSTKVETTEEPITDAQGRVILADDNYLRAYQINNFLNVSITTTVHGPGTCSVTLKGAERVVCAENTQITSAGFYSWRDLAGSWLNIDEGGTVNNGEGVSETTGSYSTDPIKKGETVWGEDPSKNSSNRKQDISGIARSTGQSWKTATSGWAGVEEGFFKEGTTFRNLYKTREAKYGWKFAEKCDWAPMDEIIIFGKSRTLRTDDVELDDDNRDLRTAMLNGYKHNNASKFKMEPIFFGYIESVSKTYDASRGCMISINAKDHLKLLEICLACTNAGAITGGHSGGPPAVNWHTIDKYGACVIENPAANQQLRIDGTKFFGPSYAEFHNQNYPSMADKVRSYAYVMTNILTGMYIDEIVQLMSAASGIPEKFLTKRIEPMHHVPPYWQDPVGQNLDVMVAQTDTRYSLCQKAAQRLMLEFFADEEGNIVLKIPNWVLGANMMQMNNCNIKYYDDLRYSDLPQFYIDNNGINVKPVSSGSKGGLLGFFASILKVLGSIFCFDTLGKLSSIPLQVIKNAIIQPNYKTIEWAKIIEELISGKEAKDKGNVTKSGESDEGHMSSIIDAFEELDNINTLEDDIPKPVTDEELESTGITDKVIEDILDNSNINVLQIDDYRIKVKLGNPDDPNYGSLYALAKRYYGNKYKWLHIAAANNIYEPTEVLPDTWLTIFFDEPISDYVINSFDDDNIHSHIQILKQKRKEKLKKLGIDEKYFRNKKIHKNEFVISSFPFIIGELIFSPVEENDKIINQIRVETQKRYNNITSENDTIVHTNADSEAAQKNAEKLTKEQQALLNARRRAADLKSGTSVGGVTLTGNTRLRSQRTDIDIPAIPSEYIISFTITDSDANVYNYIEVGGSLALGVNKGAKGNLASIYRCIPDMDSIYQLGLRQHPVVECSPLVAGPDTALLLGMMLLYKSQCNRYTGVLNCIDDSAIRVGNPIRFFIYDEHPFDSMKQFGLAQEADLNADNPEVYSSKVYREQAVFYVEGISRNIDIQGVSTMSLQLTGGRMMGMTNAFDVMSYFYDLYYLPWQSRMYYYEYGNNTATRNPHATDMSEQKKEHSAKWKESKWTAESLASVQQRIKNLEEKMDPEALAKLNELGNLETVDDRKEHNPQ